MRPRAGELRRPEPDARQRRHLRADDVALPGDAHALDEGLPHRLRLPQGAVSERGGDGDGPQLPVEGLRVAGDEGAGADFRGAWESGESVAGEVEAGDEWRWASLRAVSTWIRWMTLT